MRGQEGKARPGPMQDPGRPAQKGSGRDAAHGRTRTPQDRAAGAPPSPRLGARAPRDRARGRRTARRCRAPRSAFFTNRAAHALCTLRDSPVVDRLVRGQGWIALLGVLLIGLVGLNVSLLKLNAHNGRTAEIARDLRIQNAKLRGSVSRLGSSERLQQAAAQHGPRDADAADGQLPHRAPALRRPPRRAQRAARRWAAPTEDQLVSASPEADQELYAPTPSQPIVEQTAPDAGRDASRRRNRRHGDDRSAPATAPAGATGPAGAAGTPGG